MKEMSEDWHKRVIESGKRLKKSDYDEFVSLIEIEPFICSAKTIRTLLKTYNDNIDDFGTQECVEGTLNSLGSPSNIITLTLKEFPRLVKEAREWSVVHLSRLLWHDLNLLIKLTKPFPINTKKLLLEILLEDEELEEDFENASKFREFLENEI